jgi:Zn-dependent M28 family amino/carboxypeptidase
MLRLLAVIAPLWCACGANQRLRSDSEARCRSAPVDVARLRKHVETLSGQFVPRDFEHPENLDRAARYVIDDLSTTAAVVEEQPYTVDARTYRNVLAHIGPNTRERIVVGAHYDAAGEQPGADDNASGVAALLELARLLSSTPPPMRVDLAAYTLEEPPNFAEPTMGSAVHARSLASKRARVRLMISVEMVGAFSDEPGSQSYPPLLGLFYPSKGNFVAVVGKWGQGAAIDEVASALRTGSELPVETLSAPAFVTGVDFSDHRSFWEHGYKAVMVTDTSFYRNPRYHTVDDRPETLDYPRMAEVVKGLHCAVQAVAWR